MCVYVCVYIYICLNIDLYTYSRCSLSKERPHVIAFVFDRCRANFVEVIDRFIEPKKEIWTDGHAPTGD